MKKIITLFLIVLISGVSSCAESPTTTVVSFPGAGSCTNIRGGDAVLVRIVFMAESGRSADFLPELFSIGAFTSGGSIIGDFSRLDEAVGGVGNPLLIDPEETATPIFDVLYWPPIVTSPTKFYFDTRPFIIGNIDAYHCEIQP